MEGAIEKVPKTAPHPPRPALRERNFKGRRNDAKSEIQSALNGPMSVGTNMENPHNGDSVHYIM